MFIKPLETPNPNAVKFLLEFNIASIPEYFTNEEEAKKSFLARKILSIKGVENVFFGQDFITVGRDNQVNWDILKSEVMTLIVDHFISGLTAYDEPENKEDEHQAQNLNLNKNLSDVEKQIIEIIETKVRPAVAQDGGDIVYNSFQDGVVKLELKGACSGCPSSTITLKNGIESMLKYYLPEVKEVEAINN